MMLQHTSEFKQEYCVAYWHYYRIYHNNVVGFEVVLTFSRMGQLTHPLSKIQISTIILIVTLLTAKKYTWNFFSYLLTHLSAYISEKFHTHTTIGRHFNKQFHGNQQQVPQ